MATALPPSIPVDGNLHVRWTPAVADMNAPTMAEWTAGVDITCYLQDTKVGVSQEQTSVPDRRMCRTTAVQTPGPATATSDDITYVYDPQAADESPVNVAAETLIKGEQGYFLVRRGLPYETEAAAGQFVEVQHDELGVRWDSSSPTEDQSKYTQRRFNKDFVERAALVA